MNENHNPYYHLKGETLVVVLKDVMSQVNEIKQFIIDEESRLTDEEKAKHVEEMVHLLRLFRPAFNLYLNNFIGDKKIKRFAQVWSIWDGKGKTDSKFE